MVIYKQKHKLLVHPQVWIQKYDEEMGAAEQIYQEELAQTNQVCTPDIMCIC